MQSNLLFLEKVTLPYLTKKNGRKEVASSFFQGSCNSEHCDFLLLGCFIPVITEYGGACSSCSPFQIHLTQMEYSTNISQCAQSEAYHISSQGPFASQATLQ